MTLFSGFSKLSRAQKIDFITANSQLDISQTGLFDDFFAPDLRQQQILSEMIENYIGNFPIPMGVVTNMLINNQYYIVPFVTEESSVVAAASKAAKYWAERGGFNARVVATTRKGQVHFTWNGKPPVIKALFTDLKPLLLDKTQELTARMRQRGGGITEIQLLDKTHELPDYYQLDINFETGDAMGANFINTCLESVSEILLKSNALNTEEYHIEIIMSILSNYTPDSKVICWVECPLEQVTGWQKESNRLNFATKFKQAVDIANLDISRAVTHNKGIFNGVDAVLLATGNDTRATSAAAHAYASRNGKYSGLTTVTITDNRFRYELEIPLAIGTIGGITNIHPVVKSNLAILNHPDARKLMMIVAASGLANNFAAIASLITTGIQQGHMKMHLTNILNQLNVSTPERESALAHFSGKAVSYGAVEDYINLGRGKL